ncbi:hypothetical protein K438DRAFT_1927084 [Mycena galopus ATCC 62051]|nr:hypothetical protein K438DRAFT_1927084 [Mycena galopus ATCC 62051]
MSSPRPPKAPALNSTPSTPGPELPGGYPRNSVVFATNQWDRSRLKGKGGLLAATKSYLPPAVASYFPAASSSSASSSPPTHSDSPGRPNSVAHATRAALPTKNSGASDFSTRAWVDSDSSRGTLTPALADFPTPGGRTFASRIPTSNSTGVQSSASEDYFGSVAHSTAGSSPNQNTSAIAASTDAEEHPVVIASAAELNPAQNASTVDSNSLAPTVASPASPVSSTSNSSGSAPGSGFSAASTATTAPSSTVSSPRSLQSRPGVTYSPSTADARPAVTKAGSALVHRRVASHSLPSSSMTGGNVDGDGRRFGGGLKRFTSLRRRDNSNGSGGHVRGASLDASALRPLAPPASTTAGSSSPTASSASSATSAPSPTGGSSKPSRRASIMRTLRGEATILAGRVRGDRERVERGKRIISGQQV